MRKGSHLTDEQRARLSAILMNPPVETRVKMSASAKKRWLDPEERIRASIVATGKTCSEVTRAKMSVAQKGNTNSLGHFPSEETRAKMSAARKGHPFSEEHKARIAAAETGPLNWSWRGGLQARNARHTAKRKEFGYVYLNSPFLGGEGHHVDNEQVINIPRALHQSIRHRLRTGMGMSQINALAYNFLFKQEVEAVFEAFDANVNVA